MGVHSHANGSRVRISQVADDEISSLRERRFHAYEVFSRTERNSDAPTHLSVLVENNLHPIAGDPELTDEHGDRDGHEGELDGRVLAPLYSALIVVSVRGKTWFGILSLATAKIILSRIEMRVTSLRSNWLPCTKSLRWTHCSGFLISRWKNADIRRMPFTSSCKYTAGYDQLELGGVAAMVEPATDPEPPLKTGLCVRPLS